MRLRLWLTVLDILSALGLFGSPLYLWAVGKASDATDWGDGVEHVEGEPF
jgi:hypothetical protein